MTLSAADVREITDCTIRYCWALDQKAWSDLDDVFVADALFEPGTGDAYQGIADIKAYVAGVLGPIDVSQHLVTNHQVVEDAPGATSRCYFHAQHVRRSVEGSPRYIVAGVYRDAWCRVDDGWRIRHRVLEVLWTDGNRAVINA